MAYTLSRTLYRYVDWNYVIYTIKTKLKAVVPYIGTWIETVFVPFPGQRINRRTLYRYVDWNTLQIKTLGIKYVVPYIGTWIETEINDINEHVNLGRTLYRYVDWNQRVCDDHNKTFCRTLYRYVDWNVYNPIRDNIYFVVPYIGTWIETQKADACLWERIVVPYIGTWIETFVPKELPYKTASYLI